MTAALNQIDFKTLERMAIILALGFGVYGAYRVHQGAESFSKAIAEPIGPFLAKVQQFINGNHAIESTSAAVALTDIGLINPEPNVYIMKPGKRQSWELMHSDNKRILDAILTASDQVKPAYIGFINTREITLGDI